MTYLLSVLRFTASDCSSVVFKLFYIKLVIDMLQVGGFILMLLFAPVHDMIKNIDVI